MHLNKANYFQVLLFYSYAIVNLVVNTKINCIFINCETKKKNSIFIHVIKWLS